MMKVLLTAMSEVRQQVTRDEAEIVDALLHKPSATVENLVTDEPWLAAQTVIESELLKELIATGSTTPMPNIIKQRLEFVFDSARPEAARWANRSAGLLIKEITSTQRRTVRALVVRASEGEFAPVQVARMLRDHIGLTEAQTGWVDNFYDRRLATNVRNGMSMERAAANAEAASERYQRTVQRYRTETIARTEILRASNEGRAIAWRQGVEEGWIDPSATQRWIAESDACDICTPMTDLVIPFGQSFPNGDPPLHPNCRCTLILVDAPNRRLDRLTDQQIDSLLLDLLEIE
jgi:hypothetical protein